MPATGAAPPLPFRIYRVLTALILPLAYRIVARKLHRHGVPLPRQRERLGHASLPRPACGPLVWFHAASVGESLSVLTLITRIGERLPQSQFLITSGTATSAELIARRLPPRACHQFAPLDAPGPVRRFYDHWRPDAAVFVESELWPLMLVQGGLRGVPLALLNARLSAGSLRNWRRFPRTARFLLAQFTLMLTQNRTTADNLIAIGADPARVRPGTNLKSTSAPLPVDAGTRAELQSALAGRPLWCASSTHPGEEEAVLDAHRTLLKSRPDLCLLLVPRHPERGDAVAALVQRAGLICARRSLGETPGSATQVYLADTLGETGTWYSLAPMVFLGGSLRPIGGHNPFEPAQSGAAVLTGPHVTNFAESFAPLIAVGGAREVADSNNLAAALERWLDDPEALADARAAALEFARGQQAALEGIVDRLCDALGLTGRG